MKRLILALLAGAAVVSAAGSVLAAPEKPAVLGDLGGVGTVEFPVACDPALQKEFDRGVALLHSFFYEEARRVFQGIADRDPGCAMAHWGVAMTYYHPIWTAPDSTELARGLAAVERALAVPGTSEREAGFIRAIAAYYKAADDGEATAAGTEPSCHALARTDFKGRSSCYLKELEKMAADRPGDVETEAFYALQLVATATPGDPTLANQRKAGEILERLYAAHPDHPGLAHYLIHSYDYPPLASKGLPAAEAYAEIAPTVPHALHMPSHIFTRLGMWKETIDSNAASAAAARQYEAKYHPGAASFEELHALDYLIYGYLQSARDREAESVLARLGQIDKTHPERDFVVAYAAGAMPARFALERRRWTEAAALTLPQVSFWKQFPFAEGHVVYARAVGAARSGDVAAATRAAERLGELAKASTEPRFKYFAEQLELERQAALGEIALAAGKSEEGVALLRRAAAGEDSLGKHPVSPGAILPIRELYAEALLESGKPDEALREYRASLAIYPARFNGLSGAALAADRAGKKDEARAFYSELLAMTADGDGTRPEIAAARKYLGRE